MDAATAVKRALAMVGKGKYALGQGNFSTDHPDTPWATGADRYGGDGADCWGFAHSYCWATKRHRAGFNEGPWASVEDDINTDSAIEDAEYHKDLFSAVEAGKEQAGDLLVYHSVYQSQNDKGGCNRLGRGAMLLMGHVMILTTVGAGGWKDYASRGVQCFGPNGRRPGIELTDTRTFRHHDALWSPKPEYMTYILRPTGGWLL